MKALSVREPWATLIATGRKPIELRTWSTDYRGPLLICCGGRPWQNTTGRTPIGITEEEIGRICAQPLGIAICTVELVDVRPATAFDAHRACVAPDIEREFAWVLSDPCPVAPVPIKGRLNLFEVEWTALLTAHRRSVRGGP